MLDSSYHMDSENGMMVQSSQAYEAMLKDAHVEGQYSVDAFVEEPQEITDARKRNSYYKNVWAYDDAWISGYQPALKSGKWLQTDSTEGEYLEAVVLQNKDQYKTGDVVYVDTNSTTELQTKIPVKIIGVIDPAADIIYRSNNNGSVDYQILFSNMVKQTDDLSKLDYMESEAFNPVEFFISKKNLDCVQEAYADKESEKNLSKNYENVLKTKKQIFTTILSGVTLITMDRNCSESVYQYNKNKVAQISRFGFLHDLDYIRKNTWQNIMADLSELIPVGIGMVLFTMISFVTLSTLMYQKNMRKYSIYYVQGLTGERFSGPCIVYFYDRSGSPAAWHSGDFGSRTFWNMEWSGGAAWSRTDDRLSACCGVIAGIIGTDVSFYGERQFSQRTIWQRDLKQLMRSDDHCFRESWCIGSQRAAWKWREL